MREQDGSSLLVTLVMISVAAILVSAVLMFHLAQYRFIRRDAQRVQSRYAAEAGVYAAMDRLQQNPFGAIRDEVIALPLEQESRVTVEYFGGYVLIRSVAQYRRSRTTVRALVGDVPPSAFHNALMLWDVESSVHVAGDTRITGDIVVGQRGLKESTFKRRRFTGSIEGTVHKVPDLAAPHFDGRFLHPVMDRLDDMLDEPPFDATGSETEPRPTATYMPRENRLHVVRGTLHLTEADSLLFREPLTVVARRDLVVEGPLHFQPGTIFIAGETLVIGDAVTGREGLFYGNKGVQIAEGVRCSGQFFSRQLIVVAKDVYLSYPSVLYVAGDAAEFGGGIVVENGAVVDGTIVHPPVRPAPVTVQGRIIVEPTAQVRGAIFNAHETEFHGTLYGSLLTHQLYFYESPTSYINWLKDAVVDVAERPVKYVMPLGFSTQLRLAVLHWEIFTEEPERPL